MNTSEQITELLHGELTDDRSVAELMHLLSVSPEKRKAFLEQIAVSRSLIRSGGSIAPASAAMEGVFNRISTLESSAGHTVPPLPVQTPSNTESRRKRYGLALLILFAGLGAGYLLGIGNDTQTQTGIADATATRTSNALERSQAEQPGSMQSARESNPDAATSSASVAHPSHVSTSSSGVSSLQNRISELTGLLAAERSRNQALLSRIEGLQLALNSAQTATSPYQPATASGQQYSRLINSAHPAQIPVMTAQQIAAQRAEHESSTGNAASRLPALQPNRNTGPWRLEMRQHVRSSLPRIEGLSNPGDVFSDRELGASIRLQHPVRLGMAVGKTTFSQVYHTNTGGALNDTIIEQAPDLFYGRAYIAPQIFEADKFSASFELGLGGMELGPIGTAGINMEFQTTEHVRLQGGISSWLLWTSYRNQLHTSTNLNAHVGVSLNP